MSEFDVIAKTDIPEEATIEADIHEHYAIMTGRMRGEIVKKDDKYVLQERVEK